MKKITHAISIVTLVFGIAIHAQTQLGNLLPGENMSDLSGTSIALSDNATFAIVGAPSAIIDGAGTRGGHARLYGFNGAVWTAGADFDAIASGDRMGQAVAISGDGSIIATAAPQGDPNGISSGYVHVYIGQGDMGSGFFSDYIRLGQDLEGDDGDSFGQSIAMNDAGTRIIIGAPTANNSRGYVKIFEGDFGTGWTQIGQTIEGEANLDRFGFSVGMNFDGSRIVVGGPTNNGNGSDSGHVRVYEFNGTNWVQLGADIDGIDVNLNGGGEQFGSSVDISDSGLRIAVGAPGRFPGNGSARGRVAMYDWNGTTWNQIGQDILGEYSDEGLGGSGSLQQEGAIDLHAGGTHLVVGSSRNHGNSFGTTQSGSAKVYELISNLWFKLGSDIDGEPEDRFGTSVAINDGDGTRIVIGGPFSEETGFDSGYAKAYTVDFTVFTGGPGGTDTNWDDDANWSDGRIPQGTDDAVIPPDRTIIASGDIFVDNLVLQPGSALTVDGTINTAGNLGLVDVNSGASLIAKTNVLGSLRYSRTLETLENFLISSPVIGQNVDEFVEEENLSIVNSTERVLEIYNNNDPNLEFWELYDTDNPENQNFASGMGRRIRLRFEGGFRLNRDVSFTGDMPLSNIVTNLNIGNDTGNGYNLIGNPYPSYIPANLGADAANNILTINQSQLQQGTLWFFDHTVGDYVIVNHLTADRFIAPGQGFFVQTNANSNTFLFTEDMQSHQSNDVFQRVSNNTLPHIVLEMNDGSRGLLDATEVFYTSSATTNVDYGFDSTRFEGGDALSYEVYTESPTNSQGERLDIQSLPDNDMENIAVPIGVRASSGDRLRFNVVTIENLPSQLRVFIEDRNTNTFHQLDANLGLNYEVTINSDVDGIGRFYLHTIEPSSLSIEDPFSLNNVSVYTTDESSNLRIVGIHQGNANIEIYDILGKKILSTSFEGQGVNNLPVPQVKTGIYIVRLKTDQGRLNKKMIIE